MEWTHLKPADGRRMPWKNGGGSTLEIAVDPPGASLDTSFRWRLSSAEVASSGPFSRLPGVDRWVLLLEGAGFSLDFGARGSEEIMEPLRPVRFSGDWPAAATLLDGPCTDLNLMVDAATCRAELRTFQGGASFTLPLGPGTTLPFVARGTACLPAPGLHLGQRHALRVEAGEGGLQVVPGYGGVGLVAASIEPKATQAG